MTNPTWRGSSQVSAPTGGSTSHALTVPAGWAAGDRAYFVVVQTGGQTITLTSTNGSAGWATSAALQVWDGTTCRLTVYETVLTAADIGSTVTATFGAAQQSVAAMFALANQNGRDATGAGTVKDTASTTNAFASVTPTVDDDAIVYLNGASLAASSASLTTSSVPTSYTEDLDICNAGTNAHASLSVGFQMLTGGNGVAQTPASITLSQSARGMTLAFAVAGLGTTPISGSDTGTLSEGASAVAATVAGTDTGTLGEGTGGPSTISINRTESAGLSESAGPIALATADTAILAEGTSQVALAGADGGTLTEAVSGSATPTASDTAALSESSSVTQIGTTPAASDSLAFGEASAVAATVDGAEAFAVLEAALVNATLTSSDAYAFTDNSSVPGVVVPAVDTASFTEAAAAVPFIPPALGLGSLDDLIWGWFTFRAPGRSAADAMWNYFTARSGLPLNRALADHMVAYYAAALGVINPEDVPLTDLEIAFWQSVDPTNNKGSWAVRAQKFYGA